MAEFPSIAPRDRSHGMGQFVEDVFHTRDQLGSVLNQTMTTARPPIRNISGEGEDVASLLARVPRRIGHATDRRSFLLTDAIPEDPPAPPRHHVELFLQVAGAAGCDVRSVPRRVYFEPGGDSRSFAASFLDRAGAARFPFVAAFCTGASKGPRAWHAERFAELAAQIVTEHGAGILVLGGDADRAEAAVVLRAAGNHGIDAVGRTTVRQMAALLERCRVFVGNDSGPMHLAAALDRPVLALFGPGTPARTAPYMDPDRYVALTNDYPCSPCRQDFFKECAPAASGKPMCLESIDTRRAAAALNDLLGRSTR